MLIILHKFNTLVLIMLPFPLMLSGGADYVPFMEIISLTDVSPGRRTSLTITIIDDNDFEPDETFFLLLNPSSPGVLVNNSMAVVIIMDDDGEYCTSIHR